MEAAEHFRTSQSVDTADQLADVIHFPSRSEEGFFDSPAAAPLPYELEIADWSEPKAKYDKKVGNIETSIVTLADSSRYVFRKTIPLEQQWGTSVDFKLPLSTRVNGYNTYIARKLAQRDIHSRIIGTNQSQGFDLLHDTQAMLLILEQDDATGSTSKPGESAMIGYSMGEMTALAALGLAPLMDRDVKVSIGLDPCLANEVDYQKEGEDKAGLALYLGREALELPYILGKNLLNDGSPIRTLRRARHFVNTVGFTPEYIQNTHDKWDVIATGETGTLLGNIPEEAVMIIHFFDKSHFNDNGTYQEKLAGHPFFRAIHEQGYHLSGADPQVIGRVVDKTELALELLEQKVARRDLADALTDPILRD
jgi:hypothetical protein